MWTPYLTTGSEFYKTVSPYSSYFSVYNIWKFQVNPLKNKRDLGHRKSRKRRVFRLLPEVDESVSGRPNIFWCYKTDLINWYRFSFKKKILKISISAITSCDDRKRRLTRLRPVFYLSRSIIFENFKSLYIKHSRTRYILYKRKTAIFTDRKWIFDEIIKRTTSFNFTSTLKFSSKFIQSSLRNCPDKKWGGGNNQKQYNHYMVFRLKRKTLINEINERNKSVYVLFIFLFHFFYKKLFN